MLGRVGYCGRQLWARVRHVAARYADFPKFSVASGLAQSSSLLLTSVLISRFYSAEVLGQYSLALRAVAIPMILIASSVGHVFFQRASEAMNQVGTMAPVFIRTFRGLAIVSVVGTGLLYMTLPTFFRFAFGSEWQDSGSIARCLLPGFAVQFVVSPLTFSMLVLGRVRLGLLADLVVLAGSSLTLLIAAKRDAEATDALLSMSLAQGAVYLGYGLLMWSLVRSRRSH